MSSNSAEIVQQIHQDFKDLVEYVTDEASQTRTAYEVELTLFRQLLALGVQLLRLFFVQRAAVRPQEPVYAPDGTRLTYQNKRPTTYFSVFGKIQFLRHYFHAPGQKGSCPLDAELSLPPHCYSDLLRDWAEFCTTDESYDESNRVLKRILALSPLQASVGNGRWGRRSRCRSLLRAESCTACGGRRRHSGNPGGWQGRADGSCRISRAASPSGQRSEAH